MLWGKDNIIDVGAFQYTLTELQECLDTFQLDQVQEIFRNGAFDRPTLALLRSYLRERLTEAFNRRMRK